MSFQPVLPFSGLAGWRFLERTYEQQIAAFADKPTIRNSVTYFASNVGSIDIASQLVSDRRLLSVALGAFGLDDDINNRFFIQKILEGGILDRDSLANRLSDDRYKQMTAAFGFGDLPVPRTKLSTFPDEIVKKFQARQFEVAIGEQDNDMRLALNAESELASIASAAISEDAKWFRIMGNTPVRQVIEKALGLPGSFSQIDLDQQLEVFKDKSDRLFGSPDPAQFADTRTMDRLVQRFLLQAQLDSAPVSSGSIALTLLQAATPPV